MQSLTFQKAAFQGARGPTAHTHTNILISPNNTKQARANFGRAVGWRRARRGMSKRVSERALSLALGQLQRASNRLLAPRTLRRLTSSTNRCKEILERVVSYSATHFAVSINSKHGVWAIGIYIAIHFDSWRQSF